MASESNRFPGIEVVKPVRRYLPFLLIALVGCKPNPGSYLTKASPPHVVLGWDTHAPKNLNVSFALPKGYEPLDVSGGVKIGKNSPSGGLTRLFGGAKGDEEGTETYTVASMQQSGMGLLMVVQEDHGHNVTPGGQMAMIEDRLKRGAYKVTSKSEMDLPVGKASRLVAEMGAAGMSVRLTVYVLVDGHISYNFLFGGLSTDGSKIPTKQIMRTFRVTKLSPRS
jgi:hypothetical protein